MTSRTPTDWTDAVRLLEQATKAGLQEPPALLLLARAYKQLGRTGEARQILSKIAQPDSAALLQRGLLAFKEKEYGPAADDFDQALVRDPASYAAAYNRFLARLFANQIDKARDALPAALAIAPSDGESENRFLSLLYLLLHSLPGGKPPADAAPNLAGMSDAEEKRLLDLLVGLGRFEVAYPLLSRLVAARPNSAIAFQVYFGAVLVQAKQFLDRNQWEETKILLAPVRRRIDQHRAVVDPFELLLLYQMLGLCTALLQDFEQAGVWFNLALEIGQREFAKNANSPRWYNSQGIPQLAWLEQNLALVNEGLNRFDRAEAHWKRFVELLERNVGNSRPSDYLSILSFEVMTRLADQAQKAERWTDAVDALQRAHKFRPTDYDTLEKLFNLQTQLKKPDEARKILRRMRRLSRYANRCR